WPRLGTGRGLKFGREMECAASADFGVHPKTAVHQFDKPRADGQAKTRASEPAFVRAICLYESLEYPVPLIVRDADTRICVRKLEGDRSAGRLNPLDAQRYLSLIRKLDGIPNQVDQHLTQPPGVAHQHAALRRDIANQLEPFLVRRGGQ